MRITQEADYALRISYLLAKKNDSIVDGKTISEEINVPVNFCLKILRKLVKGGLVTSYKGASGGYKLSKKPSDITLKDIIEIIDGPIEIHRCLDSTFKCSQGEMKRTCVFHRIFDRINSDMAQKFSKISLELIADESKSADEILAIL